MNDSSQSEPQEPSIDPASDAVELVPFPTHQAAEESPVDEPPSAPLPAASDPVFISYAQPGPQLEATPNAEPQLFQSFIDAPVRPPARIPHIGHLGLLALLLGISLACTGVLFALASLYFHLSPTALARLSATNVPLMLGSEALLYVITVAFSFLIFPFFWHQRFFAGVQWRPAIVGKRFWWLAATALACAGLAALDEVLLPGPTNAPIDKMFSAPGAAWLMFAFGTSLAPFFEELVFRGFLLPSLCTAWDWIGEKIRHEPAPPLDSNGHPQWSLPAMAAGSVLTSIPFALLHVEQQGHSLGPFLLLIVISLILCTVRLKTRSLAASTLVHAMYNFIIFSLALIGTGGFRHFNKM